MMNDDVCRCVLDVVMGLDDGGVMFLGDFVCEL